MNFTSKDDVFYISDIYLDSKEIDISGRGVANLKDDLIDVTLNLKTDLASSVSQIPIVGYILFDEDSVSTSLNINGKLSDPNIQSMLAKEMIIAPLNIIKRALTLPFHLLEDANSTLSEDFDIDE